ncbi:hypothetical protein [uncultured Pseudosulfitobacter sp.]|uniref:hypothetical protein n=1 Tax=uncultured Pseudosulfitobacter sp. TaxID=2854214 RepID=UPI0030D9739A|tara:strand:- start:2893 stop:3543 length:651 start_codon:yes stop_codon:yes gene_type:complete
MARILIGCECSGTVRDAFEALGHEAWSCDLKPDERGSNRHIIDDILNVIDPANELIYGKWDMLAVMHPPCTRLCNSGVRWLKVPPPNRTLEDMWRELEEGAALFDACLNSHIPLVAVENPVMHKYAKERINFGDVEPFYVQPWHFAEAEDSPDNEKKRTGFWCKGLPKLKPTGKLDGSTARNSVHFASPGADRATERSRFFPGMARAMAEQWGAVA